MKSRKTKPVCLDIVWPVQQLSKTVHQRFDLGFTAVLTDNRTARKPAQNNNPLGLVYLLWGGDSYGFQAA